MAIATLVEICNFQNILFKLSGLFELESLDLKWFDEMLYNVPLLHSTSQHSADRIRIC